VKNTFLTVIDVPPAGEMQRSCSDSDLSSSRKSANHYRDMDLSGSAGEILSCSSSEVMDATVDPRASKLLMNNPQMWSGEGDSDDDPGPRAQSSNAGELPSKGSALHSSGGCKPCLYYLNRKDKCLLGAECGFCHEYHKKKRSRPKKAGAESTAPLDDRSAMPNELSASAHQSEDPVAAIIYADAEARGSGVGARRAAASALVFGLDPRQGAETPGSGRRLIMRL